MYQYLLTGLYCFAVEIPRSGRESMLCRQRLYPVPLRLDVKKGRNVSLLGDLFCTFPLRYYVYLSISNVIVHFDKILEKQRHHLDHIANNHDYNPTKVTQTMMILRSVARERVCVAGAWQVWLGQAV